MALIFERIFFHPIAKNESIIFVFYILYFVFFIKKKNIAQFFFKANNTHLINLIYSKRIKKKKRPNKFFWAKKSSRYIFLLW